MEKIIILDTEGDGYIWRTQVEEALSKEPQRGEFDFALTTSVLNPHDVASESLRLWLLNAGHPTTTCRISEDGKSLHIEREGPTKTVEINSKGDGDDWWPKVAEILSKEPSRIEFEFTLSIPVLSPVFQDSLWTWLRGAPRNFNLAVVNFSQDGKSLHVKRATRC